MVLKRRSQRDAVPSRAIPSLGIILCWLCVSSAVVVAEPPSDTIAPAVRFLSPSDGQAIHGTCSIVIEATDNQSVSQVTVYKSGAVLARDATAPYKIAWNTNAEADGPATLLAKALDADFNEGVSASITVTIDNQPPVVELVPLAQEAAVDGTVELEARATDAGGVAQVRWLLDGNEYASSPQTPYRLSWDTTTIANGRHALQVQAVDRAGNQTNSAPTELVVANPNHIPVLTPIGRHMAKEHERFVLELKATDDDGPRDPLTFSVSRLPPWAAFDPKTQTISGTPGHEEASSAEVRKEYRGIRVQVCDPEPLCDQEDFSLAVVDVNRPPRLEPTGDHTVKEGDTLTIKMTFSDPDQDTLICSAKNSPPWMQFHRETCALSGTLPTGLMKQQESEIVYADVILKVCDPYALCAEQGSVITAKNVTNLPPIIEPITPQFGEENRPLSVTIQAQDPEEEVLEFSAKGLPDGAEFDDRSDGTARFTWTPTSMQAGDYQLTVTVSDGSQTDEVILAMTIREIERTMTGTIVDALGSPLPDVHVKLSTLKTALKETKTDEAGFFFFRHLAPDTYVVTPSYSTRASLDFSAVGRKEIGINFSPPHRRVLIADQDARKIDFVGTVGQ